MSEEISKYFKEVKDIVDTISRDDINNVIKLLNEARLSGKRIFIVGNGGSASTATHFACDLNKYTSVDKEKRFRAISLVDNIPLMTALVNDEGWDKVYSYQLENLMD
nr:SIS domain-containing protein [Candidatus Nitrosopelagicus sp.]